MNVLTITGKKGGNQGRMARLLAKILSGLGACALVDDAGTTTLYQPGVPVNRVPSRKVFVIRTKSR